LEKQIERLTQIGFTRADAINIYFAHDNWMGNEELARIAKLELLDEMEEWRLLASHYCVAWGWKSIDGKQSAFDEWQNIKLS
jgi:[phosphatase 2A protein]-leucine-carboxy methyltransferase